MTMNKMEQYERGYVKIDLDALESNMQAIRRRVGENRDIGIMGIVKADGYGHGAVPVAKTIEPYVAGYGVATIDEALILRRHGIQKPILVLGVTPQMRFDDLLNCNISPAIFQYEKAERLSKRARILGKKGRIHIAVDTGMSRIGLAPNEESADMVRRISRLPGIEITGIFTHFAKADEADKGSARHQLELYSHFLDLLKERGVEIPIKHCANSAGIIDMDESHFNMVRAGIVMCGLYPSDEVEKEKISLTPALEWKSEVVYVKTVPAGTPVSYGWTCFTERETVIATVPVGYADGYLRNLSNRADVLIRGKRARILGRICMDQMMVDVTDIPDVEEGDPVTLIGRDGAEQITVEELAEKSGGFHYEIICGIGMRVPRVYMRKGKIAGTKDYFGDEYFGFD